MLSILRKMTLCFGISMLMNMVAQAQSKAKPLRLAIAGLTHAHVHQVLNRAKDGDFEIVGIAEPNRDLAVRYLKQYNLPMALVYDDLETMLDKTKPEAVTAFNSIYEHLEVVQACAPRNIHVMVEKPLAVSLDHARQMEALALKHNIHLLTNYETTWYGSNVTINDRVKNQHTLGAIRKVVVHDGHQGPKEIGVNKEFLDWLTDPKLNGGGALIDFGCYGANLSTWLMDGQMPQAVFAVTQQLKPDVYPKVDDEATIILTYAGSQTIIQASWNWPYARKDMEVYGERGSVFANRDGSSWKTEQKPEEFVQSPAIEKPFHDPFLLLASVVQGKMVLKPSDLSSLANNMVVMKILEAARQSAKEGRMIKLK
jgi:predicted dehydrogenase